METVLWVIIGVIVGVLFLLVGIAAFVWWKIYTSDEKKLARRIAKLRFADKLSLGVALFRDPRVPHIARLIAVALVLYLAMPLDIIPDFVPVLGYLDDLLIVVIGAGLLLRSIPPALLEEHVSRLETERTREKGLEVARR